MNIYGRREKMKIKTKKCGIYAAFAAVLLVSAVLVTNCVDPLNPGDLLVPPGKEQARFVPPPGMGYINLNAIVTGEGSGALTAFPTSNGYTSLASFAKVDVYLVAGTSTNDKTVSSWDGSTAIPVSADTYKVQVIGFNSSNVAVAFGETENVAVTSGVGVSTSVTVKEIHDATDTKLLGTGTLTWAFTNTVGATSVVMKVVGLSSGAEDTHDDGIDVYDLVGGDLVGDSTALPPIASRFSGSLTLDSGYYRIELTLTKTNYQTQTIMEIAHIWNGHTTASTIGSLTLNSNLHEVTYTFHDMRTPSTESEDFAHGADFDHPGGEKPAFVTNPVGPVTDLTRTFLGWWTTPATAGTEWIVGDPLATPDPIIATKVLRPQTLHARWSAGLDITITVNVTFGTNNGISFAVVDGDNTTITPGTYQVSQETPPVLTITASPTVSVGASPTYTWSYSLGAGGALPAGASAVANVLTVDFGTDDLLLIPGAQTFTVFINNTWSGSVTFTVP